MKKIIIKTIPRERQRYNTDGDYWETKNSYELRVSKLGNNNYEFVIALHELIEMWLVFARGVKEKEITGFDKQFEKEKKDGLRKKYEEPGQDPRAPYFKEHQYASVIEKMVLIELKEDLNKYDNFFVDKL